MTLVPFCNLPIVCNRLAFRRIVRTSADNSSSTENMADHKDFRQSLVANGAAETSLGDERLRTFFENSPEAIAILHSDLTIERVNLEFTRTFGYQADEVVGVDIRRLLCEEGSTATDYAFFERALAGETLSLEATRKRKDGTTLEVSVLVRPITTEDGRLGLYSIYREITQQKQMERLQSALYRIADKANSALDLQELYKAIHSILQELMYAKNCYIALHDPVTDMVSFPYFVDEKDPPFPPHRFGKGLTEYVLRMGKALLATPDSLEELVRRGDLERAGSPSLDWMGVPLKKGDHTFGTLVVQSYRENVRYGEHEKEILTFVSQQIANAVEHRRNQEAVRESENKFRGLAETAVQAIFIYDGARFLYVNAATEAIFGYSRRELLAMEDAWSLVDPESRNWTRQRLLQQLNGSAEPTRFEFKITTRSNEERWLDFSSNRIEFERRAAIVATAVDITQRKKAEQLQSALYRIAEETSEARDLDEFYRFIHRVVAGLMHAENFYIALFDDKSEMLSFPYFVDEEDERPEKKTLGKGLTEYVLRTGQPLLATPAVFEDLIARGEVEAIGAPSLDWLGVPLIISDKVIGVLVVQTYRENIRYRQTEKDILTFVSQHVAAAIEHKRSEDQLRSSEQRYRSLVQSAVYGIYRSTVDGHFIAVNPALIAMLGYQTEDEMLSLNIARDVYLDSSDRENFVAEFMSLKRWEGVEVKWKRKDGKSITVRLSGRLVSDEAGEAGYVEGIVEDVTERRMLEQQLRQSQKMEAVGRLAGGVAHDFNNLLTVIRGYTEILLSDLPPGDVRRAELEEIMKASDRAGSLTRQLLAFSRQQVLAPKVLNLNTIVQNMHNLLRRLLGEDIDLQTVLDPEIGHVKADPSQIEQVLMNLAVNARDAMPMGGRLTIETTNVELTENWSRDIISAKPGPYVMIAMTDSGAGMDEATKARVFEPFFTTKEQGKGTGLGLSTAYGIVKQSDGYISVYSEVGIGSTFKVYLPRMDTVRDTSNAAGPIPANDRGSETVLLVEDEEGVRKLVRGILSRQGYHVLEATSGEEALEIVRESTQKIDMLLSDVVLVGMSGRELSERLRIQMPSLKVIYMSGYTDDAIVRHGVLTESAEFLQKPFTSDSLLRKVRAVLQKRQLQ
ncbi:multi-sensor hybrid histidine kinase [Candidatus Koribacter versatilis Ellin345]|uniref:histidine kinase n=2 Tax=Candidatus Korobacter versatilis TaxID=658062 RepID=Q1IM85_KORVE|nr:multi-sensor hybrid histidine kinase [Candidatus Koribacter versatilis Ellin345]